MQNSSRFDARAVWCLMAGVLLLSACSGSNTGGKSGSGAMSGSGNAGRFSFFGNNSSVSSQGSSSSSVAPVVLNLFSSSAMPAGTLSVILSADHTDVKPNDQVLFDVIVRNVSTVAANQVKVVASFSASDLSVIVADGNVFANHVDWYVNSIEPNQKVTLRMKARVKKSVTNGQTIHTSAVLMQNGVMQPSTGNVDLTVTAVNEPLPQTGAEYTAPLEDTGKDVYPL